MNDGTTTETFVPRTSQKGPRFTRNERERVKAEVARLERRGYTQPEISQRVGIGLGQVNAYLRQIREEYKRVQLGSKTELIAEKVAQQKDVRREAWELLELSKGEIVAFIREAIQEAIEDSKISGNPVPENLRIHLAADPNPNILNTILRSLKDESEIQGIVEQPKQGDVNVSVGVQVNVWDALAGVAALPEVEDRVEQRIEAALNGEAVITPDDSVTYGLKELPAGETTDGDIDPGG